MEGRGLRFGRRDDEPAGRLHQRRAGLGLELAPERMRTLHQRHVLVAFADREPRDAASAVARAAIVRRAQAVDADRRRALAREVAQHRAAGDAEPDDDDIRCALGHLRIVGRRHRCRREGRRARSPPRAHRTAAGRQPARVRFRRIKPQVSSTNSRRTSLVSLDSLRHPSCLPSTTDASDRSARGDADQMTDRIASVPSPAGTPQVGHRALFWLARSSRATKPVGRPDLVELRWHPAARARS